MSSSDSDYIEMLNNSIIYLRRYIIPVFYILGNIGNLLSGLIFLKKSWRKNVCVFYFNICLVCNTFYINSTMLATIFSSDFNINLQNSNVFICKIFYYTAFLFSTILPTVLILASIDRLLISSQNVDTRLYSSKRLAYFSISISTLFWFIFYFHALIKVNIQEMPPYSFMCYYDLSEFYLHFVSYSSLVMNGLFCVIMVILSIFSFKNVRHIRAIPRQRGQIRSMTKKDFQLLRCLFVQDIIYIIFSIGLNITTCYQAATIYQVRTPMEQAILNFFNDFSIFIHYIPYCTSFYIFVAVSKAFRNELKRIIYKICGKELTPVREEENKQENVGRGSIELNVAVVNHIVSLK